MGGKYSGVNFGHPKSEVFRNGGGLSGLRFQKGAFWKIWTKIYCAARNLLVHHSSLSHTTYVETNKTNSWIKTSLLSFYFYGTSKTYLIKAYACVLWLNSGAILKLCVLEWVYVESESVAGYVKWAAAFAMWCEASRVKHWLCEVEQQYAVRQSALFNIVENRAAWVPASIYWCTQQSRFTNHPYIKSSRAMFLYLPFNTTPFTCFFLL